MTTNELPISARQARLERAVANRCQAIQLVLDNLDNAGNINACLRTAEGFGLLVVHIIQPRDQADCSSRTDAGAAKWLQTHSWSNPADCLATLQQADCRVLGLSLDSQAKPIDSIDFTVGRWALALGNEQQGLSPEIAAVAELVRLPLVGLVQSYNVSVAAALAIQTAFNQRQPNHADLSSAEQQRLLADYNRLRQL